MKVLIVIFFRCLSFSFGICSECTYKSRFFPFEGTLDVVCYNVSSDAILNFVPDKVGLITKLRVDGRNSTIPSLPPKWLFSLGNLRKLGLMELEIETVSPGTFMGLKRLQQLNLDGNKLSDILPGAFDGMDNLQLLSLKRNMLTKISVHYFQHLKSLKFLYLSINPISYIDDDAFASLSDLRHLSVDHNNLTMLQENLFKNITILPDVNPQHNGLAEVVFSDITPNRMEIYFNDNSLEYFNANLSQLIVAILDLHNNSLKEFDFSNLNMVNCVELSNNTISKIKNLNTLPSVRTDYPPEILRHVVIFLSNNKIKHLPQASAPENAHVTVLDLSNNEIESASCLGLSHLMIMSLIGNKIDIVKKGNFFFCKQLQYLNFSSNAIGSLDEGAFTGAESLKLIDLSNNNIKEINANIFSGLKNLFELRLHKNEIISLDAEKLVGSLPSIKSLTIYDNLLNDEDKIIKSLEQHNVRLSETEKENFSFREEYIYDNCLYT